MSSYVHLTEEGEYICYRRNWLRNLQTRTKDLQLAERSYSKRDDFLPIEVSKRAIPITNVYQDRYKDPSSKRKKLLTKYELHLQNSKIYMTRDGRYIRLDYFTEQPMYSQHLKDATLFCLQSFPPTLSHLKENLVEMPTLAETKVRVEIVKPSKNPVTDPKIESST